MITAMLWLLTRTRAIEVETFLPERKTYWPRPEKRTKPAWSVILCKKDEDLESLYDEIYLAINNEMRTLATIGIRTAFERASELLGIDEPDQSFKDKLQALVTKEFIGTADKDALEVLIDAGSAAAHRGWRPSTEEVDDLLSILEAFLHRSFIIPSKAEAVKKSVPARKKKKP